MHDSWKSALADELKKPYFSGLVQFIKEERAEATIYPPVGRVFTAFEVTPFDDVAVVILGQDPYHGPGQAHGLAFSVLPGIPAPPSLKNVYKELQEDLKTKPVDHGHLMAWAKQGVFLLNTVLTVRKGEPGSHRNHGWEEFTDSVIKILNQREQRIVFILWGREAREKAQMIHTDRHVVLDAVHPSPRSAYQGFFGCKHFSRANSALIKKGIPPINWQLPSDPLGEVPRPTTLEIPAPDDDTIDFEALFGELEEES
jgi:uracil-DNA glycosylase